MIPWIDVAAWLLTYGVHSSVALGAVWVATALWPFEARPDLREFLWKGAAFAPIVTASAQVLAGVGWLMLAVPSGSIVVPDGLAAPLFESTSALEVPGDDARVATSSDYAGGTYRSDAARGRPEVLPERPPAWSLILVGVWAVGATAGIGLRMVQRRRLRARLRHRRAVTRGDTRRLLAETRVALDVRRQVRLTTCAKLSVPVVVGRSEICVPPRALRDLSEIEWRALLGHELAHVKRGDPQWLAFMGWLRCLLFFQPLIHRAAREVRDAAEHQCDALVAETLAAGRALASCLVKVARWMDPGPSEMPLVTMAEPRSGLALRVVRLLSPRPVDRGTSHLSGSSRLVLAAGLVVPSMLFLPGFHAELVDPTMVESISAPEETARQGPGDARARTTSVPLDRPEPRWNGYARNVADSADASAAATVLARPGRGQSVRERLLHLLVTGSPGVYLHLSDVAGRYRIVLEPTQASRLTLASDHLSLDLGPWQAVRGEVGVLAARENPRYRDQTYVVSVPNRPVRVTLVVNDDVLLEAVPFDGRAGPLDVGP